MSTAEARRNTHVLVVDDNQVSRSVLDKIIGKHLKSAHVLHASTLDEARDLMAKKNVVLIFLDRYLDSSEHDHGVHFIKECRSIKNLTPIIISSAENDRDEVHKALDAGANDYISKPFDLERIKASIDRFIKVD